MTFSQTSFNYQRLALNDPQTGANLDRDLKMIFGSHALLDQTAVKSPTFSGGFALAGNTVAVTAGAVVATGLTSVTAVVVSLNGGQGVPLNVWVTANPHPTIAGSIQIWTWQPTSSTVNTPVAAAGPLNVYWIAIGPAQTTAAK